MRAAAAAVRPKSRASVTKSRRESRSSFATGLAACPLSVAVTKPSARTRSSRCLISAWSRHRMANESACSGRSRPSAISVGATRSQKAAAAGTAETFAGMATPPSWAAAGDLRARVFRPVLDRSLFGSGMGPREPMGDLHLFKTRQKYAPRARGVLRPNRTRRPTPPPPRAFARGRDESGPGGRGPPACGACPPLP